MAKVSLFFRFKQLLSIVFFWVFAFILYDVIRFSGFENIASLAEGGFKFSWWISFEYALTLGLITGLLYYCIEFILDHNWFKRKSYGIRFLIKILVYLGVLLVDAELAGNLFGQSNSNAHQSISSEILNEGLAVSFVLYFLICSALYSFAKIVHEKFGLGVFWKMLIGKYTPPRIEKKIFMFLDMKSSTTIAETLGYEKFSRFVQQCFYDLNEVLPKFHGEIYQYVGDEAVIVWDFEKGNHEEEIIDLFFRFLEKLKSRSSYYEENFGYQPEFKAGVHGGELVVAEVGVAKKELAYHGDVINTTSRIQGLCNNLNEKLLISQDLLNKITHSESYNFTPKGDFILKGKHHKVSIVGVTLNREAI